MPAKRLTLICTSPWSLIKCFKVWRAHWPGSENGRNVIRTIRFQSLEQDIARKYCCTKNHTLCGVSICSEMVSVSSEFCEASTVSLPFKLNSDVILTYEFVKIFANFFNLNIWIQNDAIFKHFCINTKRFFSVSFFRSVWCQENFIQIVKVIYFCLAETFVTKN